MGNTLPITPPPKPSASRAVIFMEPQCIRGYLREPWRQPVGQLRLVGSTDELPPALVGLVPIDAYKGMLTSISDRAAAYKGGMATIGVAIFQACICVVIVLGFFCAKTTFFNPITIVVLGTLEFGVLLRSGRFYQREETVLIKDMLEVLHPWRQEYGIIAKMRKTRTQRRDNDGEAKTIALYYCLVLDKMGPDDDEGTVTMSTFTDEDSDVESQVR